MESARPPSSALLETIYECQRRQAWFREYLEAEGEEPLLFVGSAQLSNDSANVAHDICTEIGLNVDERLKAHTAEEALRALVERVERARILVMRNGIVGDDTSRPLNIDEFRGFALSDAYAPLVFINSTDAATAKSFTLAHELGHIWLGHSGVSDTKSTSIKDVEQFCNAVAAEVLVPLEAIASVWRQTQDPAEQVTAQARRFKVSNQTMTLRVRDAGLLSRQTADQLYAQLRANVAPRPPKPSGGDYYRTKQTRVSPVFARAIMASVSQGKTTYTEALHLLGLRRMDTYDKLAHTLEVHP